MMMLLSSGKRRWFRMSLLILLLLTGDGELRPIPTSFVAAPRAQLAPAVTEYAAPVNPLPTPLPLRSSSNKEIAPNGDYDPEENEVSDDTSDKNSGKGNKKMGRGGARGHMSPVSLSSEWSFNKRLLAFVGGAATSILFNGLFIAAFFVVPGLRKSGNTFLCCLGLMDMVAGGVVPIFSVVAMLAGEDDSEGVCHVMHCLITFVNYGYMLLSTLCATENYYRVAWATKGYEFFNKKQVSFLSVSALLASATFAGAGVFLKLDYDYCSRTHVGNMEFRYTTLTFFYGIPLVLTCFYLGYAMIRLLTRSMEPKYKRSQKHDDDLRQIKINSFIYSIYICSWIPYMIAIYRYPQNISDKKLYTYAWIGIARSVYVPILYSIFSPVFRTAYIESFFYCCCRSSFPARGQYASRHRRATEYKTPSGDVRVHIMHQVVHPGSPQRATLGSREVQEL